MPACAEGRQAHPTGLLCFNSHQALKNLPILPDDLLMKSFFHVTDNISLEAKLLGTFEFLPEPTKARLGVGLYVLETKEAAQKYMEMLATAKGLNLSDFSIIEYRIPCEELSKLSAKQFEYGEELGKFLDEYSLLYSANPQPLEGSPYDVDIISAPYGEYGREFLFREKAQALGRKYQIVHKGGEENI